MGNTVSRCGNRVQEFITCSRNAKPDEKNSSPNSEQKSSPGERKSRKKWKTPKSSKAAEGVTKAEISVTPEENCIVTPVEADKMTEKDEADKMTQKDEADKLTQKDEADKMTQKDEADKTTQKDEADKLTQKDEADKMTQTKFEDKEQNIIGYNSEDLGLNSPLSEVEKVHVLENTEDGGLSDIERRQEAILHRLQELSEEVQQLAKESGVPLLSPPTSTAQTTPTTRHQTGVIEDLVVTADPDKPPLSLFICLHLLQRQHKVLASVHVHSSVREIDPNLKEMFRNGPQAPRSDYDYALTVVWKKENRSPSLVVDPHRQVPIIGEANIARYLARLLTPAYDSGDILEATLIDNWLDTATHQLLNGNSKEKAAAIRNLNSRLGKNDWLATSSLSLADVVTWSAVFQSGQAESVPANVKKWLNSCSNLPAFQLDHCLFR